MDTLNSNPEDEDTAIIIGPVLQEVPPARSVGVDGWLAASAHDLDEVKAAVCAKGFQSADLDNPAITTWKGGGPDVWS
jgi:hypothetical protein